MTTVHKQCTFYVNIIYSTDDLKKVMYITERKEGAKQKQKRGKRESQREKRERERAGKKREIEGDG